MIHSIDDFNRGDTIKIVLLDDPIFNLDYRNKKGVIEHINYRNNTLTGTWGKIELYPEYDDIEILNHVEFNYGGWRNEANNN